MLNTGRRLNDSIVSGLAGAAALTAVHQAARAVTDSAPRMDVLGMRALSTRASREEATAPGSHKGLYRAALAGDLLFNSAYYSLARTYKRGLAMGVLAGVGALVLPQRLGLGAAPKSELLSNQLMTVAWYTIGGLVAAATAQRLAHRRDDEGPAFAGA